MIHLLVSNVGQLIKTGKVFQLLFLITIAVVAYASAKLSERGRRWAIRPLEGLEAIYEGIGRSAEMGRPVMVLPGIGGLGSPHELAGLTVLGEVAQKAAELGIEPLTTASRPEVLVAEEAIIRSSYEAAGKPELYTPGKSVRWFGNDQFSYAMGTAGLIIAEKPQLVCHTGDYLWDVIIVAETGARIGAVQVGGGTAMPSLALFCDYLLITEELFAASAQISQDERAIATIAGQDWVKLGMLLTIIVGSLLMWAGSDIVYQILRM